MSKILIKNATIVNEGEIFESDLLIVNKLITTVTTTPITKTINCVLKSPSIISLAH